MKHSSRPVFQRVLVLHPGALGDLLLSLPACRDLRAVAAGLTVAGKISVATLLEDAGEIDEAASFDAAWLAELFGPGPLLSAGAEARLTRHDLIVSWAGDGEGNLPRHVARYPAIRSIMKRQPRPGDGSHPLWETYRRSLRPALSEDAACLSPIRPGPQARTLAAARLRREGLDPFVPFVAIHPGAGGEAKRWDPAGFEAVGRAVARDGVTVVVLEGPAEPGLGIDLARRLGASARAVVCENILELAGLLVHCSVAIGNDAGPTHLAAAIGIPTIAIYRSTDFRVWSPWGPRILAISASGNGREDAARVIAAVRWFRDATVSPNRDRGDGGAIGPRGGGDGSSRCP